MDVVSLRGRVIYVCVLSGEQGSLLFKICGFVFDNKAPISIPVNSKEAHGM